jgi:hypothetical protein
MRAPEYRLRVLALVGALAFTPALQAQPTPAAQSDAANRETARTLALEGIAAQQRADWATVIARFERAEQLFHAPVHLKYLAIAYERSTPPRMVQAIETWQRLSQEHLPPEAPAVFRAAVDEAQREFARLDSRIGHLVIEVPASLQGQVTIELDGQAYPAESLNTVRFVDAGQHRIVDRAPNRPQREHVINISPGATERVQIEAPAAQRVEVPVVQPPRTEVVLRPNPLRTVGIITAGVGAAALIGGVITGVMANGQFADLETACPNRRCPNQAALDQRNSVDTLATATTGLLVAGGVLAAAGVTLFFVGRPREETVQVAVGPRSVELSWHF